MTTHDGIIPVLISKVPATTLSVIYPNQSLKLGQELKPLQVKDEPEVKWEGNANKFYTLLMLDPDAPSKGWAFVGPVNHWLIGNISGSDLSTGTTIVGYRGSGPPRGTGLHRYIFLLFEHDEQKNFEEKIIPKEKRMGRLRFDTDGFRKKYGFEEVYAWNYFNAQWNTPEDNSWRCTVL